MTDTANVAGATEERATPVSVVTAEIQSGHDLGHLFRSLAESLFDVPEWELSGMHTVPVPSTAAFTVAGDPLPASWYRIRLPGAPQGTVWALCDSASLVERRWQFSPYPEVTIDGTWGRLGRQSAPFMDGWRLTLTMVMDPDTTLLRTVTQHRKLVTAVAISGRKSLQFQGPPGVLHMESLGEFMAA